MRVSEICLWPEPALDVIEQMTREVLRRVGVKVLSPAARDLMTAVGCTQLADDRLAIPWDVVERAAESAPRRFTLAARDEARSLTVGAEEPLTWTHPLGGAPYVCDVDTGEQRRADFTDVAAAARLQHRLQRPDLVSPLFMPGSVPGDLEPLISYVVCLQETRKCVTGPPLWSVEQVRGVCRLAEAAVGADREQDISAINLSFSPLSPLTLAGGVADALVEAARLGASCTILPCPIAGTTAPAPIAAALAQQTAEALAGVVLAQAARPGTPVICGSRLMPCDSHTGAAVMGGPELARAAQAATFLVRRLGLPSDVYGLSTDSKVVDAQFGWERAIGALLAAMARPAFVSGMGFMQSGVGGSLEALVIDDEIFRWVEWSVEERPVDDRALDVDELERGVSSGRGFLGLRQTRTFMRSEKVKSRLAYRGTQEDWLAGGRGVVDRARGTVIEALAQEPVGFSDDLAGTAHEIVADAAQRMGLGEAPDLVGILAACQSLSGTSVD